MNDWMVKEIIKRALEEDLGNGDITTRNLIAETQKGQGLFWLKPAELCRFGGLCRRFSCLEPAVQFTAFIHDGDEIKPGDRIARVEGKMSTLLTGERVALNFLQRLSGIASKTHNMAESIKYQHAVLVDTRKTTPGLRLLEKYAVRVGGAKNHRFGLYDGVMIKDNHIQAVGGIQKAVSTLRQKVPHTLKIEVEVENLQQLQEALEARADIILLDNMDAASMRKAVEIVNGQALLEASGGVNEENIVEIAKTGVDFISCGALTHSAPSLDISFKIQ